MIEIELLADRQLVGIVRFTSIRAGAEIYSLNPPDILSPSEAEHLAAVLCKMPAKREGLIGKYEWRERLSPGP